MLLMSSHLKIKKGMSTLVYQNLDREDGVIIISTSDLKNDGRKAFISVLMVTQVS